jgi:hypothetical protein
MSLPLLVETTFDTLREDKKYLGKMYYKSCSVKMEMGFDPRKKGIISKS